nr:hypothetical protein [Escherichia coli]
TFFPTPSNFAKSVEERGNTHTRNQQIIIPTPAVLQGCRRVTTPDMIKVYKILLSYLFIFFTIKV